MRSHLDSVSCKSGCVLYLLPTIQNKIISLLGERVRKYIITECKKAKYFSFIFDTTSDAAHIEQMSQLIRFVEIKCNFLIYINLRPVSYTHLDVYKRQAYICNMM